MIIESNNQLLNYINLKKLNLKKQYISKIKKSSLIELNYLEEINLSENKLTSLGPNIFDGLNNLYRLELNSNQLTALDPNIFNGLNNLSWLHLNSNQLTSLDQNIFNGLNNLSWLGLKSNQLTSLDPNIFNGLNNLSWLHLNSNKLTSLDQNIFNGLNNLSWLELNSNQLTSLDPNIFEGLNNLFRLELNSNHLTSLDPKIFNGLNKLKGLYLNSNQLTSLEPKIFNGLNNLETLELNSNQLTSLGPNIFDGLNNLFRLELNSNQLTALNPNIFNGLNNLETLALNSNQITSLDPNIFNGLNNLFRLHLNSNHLTSLDPKIFNGLNKLEQLDLNSNNFQSAIFSFSNSIEDISLFFNHIRQCKLSFKTVSNKCNINLSSNCFDKYLHCFNDCSPNTGTFLVISSGQSIQFFSFNLRFNFFKTISDFQPKSFQYVDLRNNYISNLPDSPNIKVNDEINEIFNPGFIDKIYFNKIDYHSNFKHLKSFNLWENIPMFTVLTGKNGTGKSTLLNFIENSLYQTIIESYLEEKEFLIEQESGKNYNKKLSIENEKSFSIPVLLKLHESIVSKDEIINNIKKKFRNHGNLSNGLSILSVYNLDSSLMFLSNKLDILNQHLQKNEFKYTVSKEKDTFYFKYNLFKVTLKQLSPGEQLMLQLYIWEFVLTRFPFKHKFVLLLDEPDAHLHPKAVHDFIAILKKVCMAGAQIIMTTHNPITVSFLDPENLFVIKKQDSTQEYLSTIENNSKANIIRELSEDVVMVKLPLKVIYPEADKDKDYYSWIQSALSFIIKFKSQFQFEKSKIGKDKKGGCNLIRQLLSNLLDVNIFNHFGIVDNDNIHIIHDQVIDLNKQYLQEIELNNFKNRRRVLNIERHSIENYILDPIYFFFYIKKLFSSVVQFNFDKLVKLENDIVSDCFSRLKQNGYSKSKELNKFIQQYLINNLTIHDIYLDTNDAKYFTSEKVKKQISLLEKVFKVKYFDFCKIFLTSIVNNFAYILFEYLIEYDESKLSYKIFHMKATTRNETQVAYKLINLFCFLPNKDAINSVDFLFNILNNFDDMINRFNDEIIKTKDTDINNLNLSTLDDFKRTVFHEPTLPIIKSYLDVCKFFQNLKQLKIDEFKNNLLEMGIIFRERVDRNKINELFQQTDSNIKDEIENLIQEFLDFLKFSEKDNSKLFANYTKLTHWINFFINKEKKELFFNFQTDKIKALKKLKDFLIKNKLLILDKSEKNEIILKLNTVLNNPENQYENINKFVQEFDTVDTLNRIIKSTKKAQKIFKDCQTIESIIQKNNEKINKRLNDFIEQNKNKPNDDLYVNVQLLKAVLDFRSSKPKNLNLFSLEDLKTKLIDSKIVNDQQLVDTSKLNEEQQTLKPSVENIMELITCHQKYSNMKNDFENLKAQFNITTNDSIIEQLHKKLIENNLITVSLEINESNLKEKSDFQKWILKKYLKIDHMRKIDNENEENRNDDRVLKQLKN